MVSKRSKSQVNDPKFRIRNIGERPFCHRCTSNQLLAVTNEDSDQGMEDWYEYQITVMKIDKSELGTHDVVTNQENCRLCGEAKKFGKPPRLD